LLLLRDTQYRRALV